VACAVYKQIQQVRKVPEPPPPLSQLTRYGARWPFSSTSPRP
jgi:hypothetical protein